MPLDVTNKKDIFNFVKEHLLKQNARAADYTGCAYLADNGLKCAIGCLIPENEYSPTIEGKSVGQLKTIYKNASDYPFMNSLLNDENLQFLQDLQFVHDKCSVREWEEKLAYISEMYNLNS